MNQPIPDSPESRVERRQNSDRRHRPTPIHSPFTSTGRRAGFRRTGEEASAYVDRPGRGAVAWALAILVLSAFDAYLTILHVRAGGEELVPTMRLALDHGESTFVVAKMGVTGVGVVFLALHEHFLLARIGFRVLLGIYSVLMAYHLFLMALR